MGKIKDGGPAFPYDNPDDGNPGMTLRDWFAGQVVDGIQRQVTEISKTGRTDLVERFADPKSVAKAAYQLADAMIAERESEDHRDGDE